ncbi:gliding motility lipoprotein GldD [Flavobacterium sp. MFBS3-15]|uniref:gliding motility lipoprotein GldD n=1 Tax=Flavobacterium sp. MFBS3-15 TaxID=2989816 RepID=UPI0022369B6F|nr:gliding motility lipoprotein GldD [Flavobacterium sp. MFBS3-15]MCW4468159.1 gliding motility lipoprotein GldD [Flavobacterium sp. MFBS3-15]
MKILKRIGIFAVLLSFAAGVTGCGEDAVPKPQAYLRLDYPMGTYVPYTGDCPYTFGYNSLAKVTDKGNCNLVLQYPKMKATVFLTYKQVDDKNLELLLRDAQKLTYEHVIKADEILEQPYLNYDRKVYGMFYQVGGNAATNAQFYVTDSTRHFLTGSMYFYAKPNYDSILPAASYIKDDMRNLMETIRWK